MNELTIARRTAEWQRLKPLVLDSVSSPITKRVYNMALDEFFAWYDARAAGRLHRGHRLGFGASRSKSANLGRPASSSECPPSGNWRSRPWTTDCWRRNWPPAPSA